MKKISFIFVLFISLFFVNSSVKAAVTSDMFFVQNQGYVNTSQIYSSSFGITSNVGVVNIGNSVNIRFITSFQTDKNIVGNTYFLKVDICTGWSPYEGITDVNNFSGSFQYNDHVYHNVGEIGSCSINGQNAILYQDIYTVTISSLTPNTEEGGYVGSGNHGYWSGNYTTYESGWKIQNVQFLDYDLNFLNQLEINNSNQIIINSQQETNDKLDDITSMDIPDESKEDLDDSSFQDYSDAESDLMDSVGEADLSNVDIAIDSDSSNFIWDTITDIFNSHPLIMSTVIAILSIGIIKLALGR